MRAFLRKTIGTVPLVFLFHSLFGESYKVTDLLTASSPNASRDVEWNPGDGIPLEVSGMEWMGGNKLALCIRKGEVWYYDTKENTYELFASGLHEPLGLLNCLLYTSPSPRDRQKSRMPSSA